MFLRRRQARIARTRHCPDRARREQKHADGRRAASCGGPVRRAPDRKGLQDRRLRTDDAARRTHAGGSGSRQDPDAGDFHSRRRNRRLVAGLAAAGAGSMDRRLSDAERLDGAGGNVFPAGGLVGAAVLCAARDSDPARTGVSGKGRSQSGLGVFRDVGGGLRSRNRVGASVPALERQFPRGLRPAPRRPAYRRRQRAGELRGGDQLLESGSHQKHFPDPAGGFYAPRLAHAEQSRPLGRGGVVVRVHERVRDAVRQKTAPRLDRPSALFDRENQRTS